MPRAWFRHRAVDLAVAEYTSLTAVEGDVSTVGPLKDKSVPKWLTLGCAASSFPECYADFDVRGTICAKKSDKPQATTWVLTRVRCN